ncbi:MAG TPA: zf-HC2 domain-containing protein [bacterium]|nr:zf-HC2 domain-containing protein [bacterium]HMW32875.1 zf-HC2 domain-containing protein [bacterium]HMW35304.1 zf-HC2 domain-containing protein [bacterium]HMY35101.1 zf-HC2 domain-containing protein [bacterium]HMZ04162.1 zf-HC2 domain-containing protein [bacterium]
MSHVHHGEAGLHAQNHPINCGEIERLLYAYLDGELPLEEVAPYKDHLSHCPPCKAFVEFEEKISHLIKQKCGHNGTDRACVPTSLHEKIQKAIALSKEV